MTLKNGFGKCLLFVLSANGWKDQNMDSSSSRPKAQYGEGIVQLANRVAVTAVWCQSEVSIDFWKFSGMKFFHLSVRVTNQKPSASVSFR